MAYNSQHDDLHKWYAIDDSMVLKGGEQYHQAV